VKTILATFLLCLSAAPLAPGQSEKTVTHIRWVCLEPTITAYSEPERRLNFVTITPSSGCRIAVPVSAGEKVEIDSDSLDATDRLESVFGSIDNAEVMEQNRKNNGEPFTEFPHNGFYTTLIQQFNYSSDGARAKFCALYPRAYVPFLDWHGLTEPKPCSDKAPRL
jgi:hypothetical protein